MSCEHSVVCLGDWRGLHARIRPASAALVYADPPFGTAGGFDTYQDDDYAGFVRTITDLLHSSQRWLKKGGTLWIHLNQESSRWAQRIISEHSDACLKEIVRWERIVTPKSNSFGLGNILDDILIVTFDKSARLKREPFTDNSMNLHRSWDGDSIPWISGDLSGPRGDEHPEDVYGITNPMTGIVHYPPPGRRWTRDASAVADMLSEWAPGVEIRDLDDRPMRQRIIGYHAPQTAAAVCWNDPDQARETALRRQNQGCWPDIFFGRSGTGSPRLKRPQRAEGLMMSDLWRSSVVGSIAHAKTEIRTQVPTSRGFSTPKPQALLRRIIEAASNPGDLVVDPFAGSGTTAVVAHSLGRRFVTSERSAQALREYVLPRLRYVDAGHPLFVDERLVHQLPYSVRTGEPSRAADVLTLLCSDGRIDADLETVREIQSALRAADATRDIAVHTEPLLPWRCVAL